MNRFTYALKQRNLEELRKYPKADLHNHFVLGGSRSFLYQAVGKKIEPLKNSLSSMGEMDQWSQKYIGQDFNSTEMRKLLIKATFQQAKEDGVTVLEIGEDVWGLNEFFHNDIDELVDAFTSAQKEIAPDIELRLQIGLSRHCPIDYLEECLSHFWGNKNFYSIDLYGDELAQPIENFKGIYRRARKEGLRLKAHVGEWGTAKDVRTAVEELELDELKWNEGSQRFETTLSDSNGVLSDFDFGISGYSVDKNGNSITISSTSVNTTATTGTFTSNAGKVETTSSCVFWLTGKSGYLILEMAGAMR